VLVVILEDMKDRIFNDVGDVAIRNGVSRFSPGPANGNQPRRPQRLEMLRHERL